MNPVKNTHWFFDDFIVKKLLDNAVLNILVVCQILNGTFDIEYSQPQKYIWLYILYKGSGWDRENPMELTYSPCWAKILQLKSTHKAVRATEIMAQILTPYFSVMLPT